MNGLILIRTAIDEFTESLILFCKPLMLDAEYRKETALLLGAESDLRMTIELACYADSIGEIIQKSALSLEGLDLICDVVGSMDIAEATPLHKEAIDLKTMLENFIERMETNQ